MKYFAEKDGYTETNGLNDEGLSSSLGESIYHSLPVSVAAFRVILDAEGSEVVDAEFIYANERYLQRMGLSEEDFKDKTYMEKVRRSDDKWNEIMWRAAVMGETVRERLFVEEVERWVEFTASPGPERFTCIMAFMHEVSEVQKVDMMTQLPNRTFFMQLGQENSRRLLSQGKNPVVFTCDLMGMRSFNLKYGMKEGDILLCEFASLLSRLFGRTRCSRFGEDHFYVSAPEEGLTEALEHFFHELKGLNEGRSLPVRVGICKYYPDVPIDVICDRARLAARSLERSVESNYIFFREDMSEENAKRYYILTHLDEAMEKGWIMPYYQPVIRTLTGRLCNLEALARWNDPEYGFIPPGEFIPLLEENGMSHKLDIFIVEQVADMLKRRISMNEALVPVSVNISRSDFDYCDPVDVISHACDRRGVRRELIAVEITESALISNEQVIESAIRRFHKAGFEVWMDDFGSGYSSLNFLKDFEIDEIKVDLMFMKNFNEKSKVIVTMAVRMAKALGIHTLAEGVETEEQVQFLKSIGCERIQGFCFGRPMPEELMIAHLRERGIVCEDREISSFYQKTGLLNLISNQPLALFLYDDESFTSVFVNAKYEQEINYTGLTSEDVVRVYMNSGNSPVYRQLRVLAENAVESGRRQVMTVVIKNRYYHFSFTHVAESRFGHMLKAGIDGTLYEEQKNLGNLDMVIRNFINVYECIYIVDLNENSHTVISSDDPEEHNGDVIHGVDTLFEKLKKRQVHPNEKAQYRELFDISRIRERLDASGKGNFSDMFIMKEPDGSYIWKVFLFVALPETEGSRFMICIKPSAVEEDTDKKALINRMLIFAGVSDEENNSGIQAEWWKSFLNQSNLKLFWKDRDRRFLGASQAFLDYYGFESEDVIKGKTDEDVGWHVDDVPYMLDERKVIEKGEPIINVPGINVVDGVMVRILANKFPVYHEGKIVGLVGYFIDVTKDLTEDDNVSRADILDTVTGLLNAKGGLDAMLEMDNNLRTNGGNYVYTQLTVEGYDHVLTDFGEAVAQHLIREIAEVIKRSFSEHAVIARVSGCLFNVYERADDMENTLLEAERCVDEIENIRYIDDRICHLHAKVSMMSGTDERMKRNIDLVTRFRH